MKLTITSNGFTGNIVATVALLFGNDLLSDALTVTAAQISLKKKKRPLTTCTCKLRPLVDLCGKCSNCSALNIKQ